MNQTSFTVVSNATGEIMYTGSCPADSVMRQPVGPTERVILGTYAYDKFYWDGAAMQPIPARPSASHRWSWQSHSWVPDLAAAKADKIRQIERERERRMTAPIWHRGALLDADAGAQRSLLDKLAEIQQRLQLGIPMPAEHMAWRDAGNTMHAFGSLQQMQQWLGELAISVAQRSAEARAWSWEKKAEVQAAATWQQVEAVVI